MVDNPPDDTERAVRADRRRRVPRWRWIVSGVLALVLLGGWLMRNQLAGDLIDDQLASLDLPASYTIDSIEPGQQVLSDIVVGDPDDPDLTIERVVVSLDYGLGLPSIGTVRLVRPRLYGRYDENGISFGSLDKVLFAQDSQGTGLPAIDVEIEDGRALVETGYGPVGVKIEGGGDLSGGFAAMLAVNAPELSLQGCVLQSATAYGELSTEAERLRFSGPLRLKRADCAAQSLQVANANLQLDSSFPTDFKSANLEGSLRTGRVAFGDSTAATLTGPIKANWRGDELDVAVDLGASAGSAAGIPIRIAKLDGILRSRDGFSRFDAEGSFAAEGLDLHRIAESPLRSAQESAAGTLLEPLLARMRAASGRQLRDTSLDAGFVARGGTESTSVVIPALELTSAGGGTVLTASRLQYASGLSGVPQLSGNLRTGGGELPQIAGRMERDVGGDAVFRLRMQPYTADTNRLALPDMTIRQRSDGTIDFDGLVEAGGQLPGGSVRDLKLPVQGSWGARSGLAMWDSCATVAFDRLEYANLLLSDRDLRVCPANGQPIVSQVGDTLRIAAGLPALDLSGTLAGTPIRVSSGPVGFAYPGNAVARDLDIALGPEDSASRFTLSDLRAEFATDGRISGTFAETDVRLAAIPLDIVDTSGAWTFADGALQISGGRFRVLDRQSPARFNLLEARDATLRLADNVITAEALLRNPGSDRVVSATTIRHDLSTSMGGARLAVDGLQFDDRLQPDQLTDLALGVVANVEGVVTGNGRIDWTADAVTSSGEFSTAGLDLAAAFGPVRGARGTLVFTDLLSLTSAPDQRLQVASINPGIEVNDGVIGFTLRDGVLLGVTGGEWPFMGGRLYLRPVDLNLGASEVRRYVLEVEGLDAAIFIQTLELGNIAATGIFDGSLPLVFDEMGNGRIERGTLVSRPPGGNLSYVGELTYEDMSFMVNYAFDMLRSLDYRVMEIEIEGPLTGDILSQIRMDGVRQGEDAKRNFITRQLEDVPIQFNINVNAPFYKLIGTFKSMYDPAAVRDPRDLGLLTDDGVRLRQTTTQDEVEQREQGEGAPSVPETPGLPQEEPAIQRPESEKMP